MLDSVVEGKYEGEASSSSSALKVRSLPSDVMISLEQFVRNIRVPDTTQELLKFGGKLVVDGATTTGVRLRSKKRPEAGKQYDKLERLVVVACGSRVYVHAHLCG